VLPATPANPAAANCSDGHGGPQAAQECKQLVHKLLLSQLDALRRPGQTAREAWAANLNAALTGSFRHMDVTCKERFQRSGSTATVVVIARSPRGPGEDAGRVFITVANVGDSHAVLDTESSVVRGCGARRGC
jgi:serine/threonine protein phosphatase PrpC